MEIYAVLRVNDSDTGELLEKVDGFFLCGECESLEEFEETHGDDVTEYLENKLEYDYDGTGAIARVDFVQLADDFDDEDDNGDEE